MRASAIPLGTHDYAVPPEREMATAITVSAIHDLTAPYPRKRLVRRCPGRVQSRNYRIIKPEDLAAERTEFNRNFCSAVEFFFGQRSNLPWIAAGLGLDIDSVRGRMVRLLEERRYAKQTVKRQVSQKLPKRRAELLASLYLPGRYQAHWRRVKRRLNFNLPTLNTTSTRLNPTELNSTELTPNSTRSLQDRVSK